MWILLALGILIAISFPIGSWILRSPPQATQRKRLVRASLSLLGSAAVAIYTSSSVLLSLSILPLPLGAFLGISLVAALAYNLNAAQDRWKAYAYYTGAFLGVLSGSWFLSLLDLVLGNPYGDESGSELFLQSGFNAIMPSKLLLLTLIFCGIVVLGNIAGRYLKKKVPSLDSVP